MKRLEVKRVLWVEADDDTYVIQTKLTSKGQRFRLQRESLGFAPEEPDIQALWENDLLPRDEKTVRGKWVSSLQAAIAALPVSLIKTQPVKVDRTYGAELWRLCIASSKGLQSNELTSSHLSQWKEFLAIDLPVTAPEPDPAPALEVEIILALAGEGGGYDIERIQSPNGYFFRLQSSGMGWDDEADEECWSTHFGAPQQSIDQVFAELNPKWHRLYVGCVHPDFANEIWERYLTACNGDKNYPLNLMQHWSEVVLGK